MTNRCTIMLDDEKSNLSFEDILDVVGKDGPFQKRFNIVFNFLLVICATMPYFNLVIALAVPEHWCKVPGREHTNYSLEEWKDLTIPKDASDGRISFNKCKMFDPEFNLNETINASRVIDCQHGWEYDKTWYTQTAVSQEDWVCEKELYVTNTFAFCRIGELIGSFIAGQLGDTIGRKPVLLIALIALAVGKFSTIFTASNFSLFLTSSLIGSLTSTAVFTSPLIIGMEISTERDRTHIAMLQCLGWTIGLAGMPFVMWAVGHWVYFMILTTLPSALFILLYRYTIESPRWLLSKGKTSRCLKELQEIAKVNKTVLPEDAIITLSTLAKNKESVYGALSLFSHWRIAKNTLCIISCWVVTAVIYFILILNTNNLVGNPFLNFFYQGLAEFPGYIIAKYSCNYFGRRLTHMGAFLGTGLGCIPLIVLITNADFDWLATAIAIFLKFSISFAFYGVNLHALEIYPTCLRQTGMALGAVSANGFGILGPYIVYLGTTFDARWPYIILALLSVFAACCSFALPETLNYSLPETVTEASTFGTDQQWFSMPKRLKEFELVKS